MLCSDFMASFGTSPLLSQADVCDLSCMAAFKLKIKSLEIILCFYSFFFGKILA